MKTYYAVYGLSGSGKTTLLNKTHNYILNLINTQKRFEQDKIKLLNSIFYQTISSTTRKERVAEMHLIDYKFYSKNQFLEKDFIETAEFNNEFYGTEKCEIEQESEIISMVLEVDGIIQVSKKIKNLKVVFMNIDKETIIKNLINEGYTQTEALNRYNRGNILNDRQKLITEGIEDTLEITNLDKSLNQFMQLIKNDSITLNSLMN